MSKRANRLTEQTYRIMAQQRAVTVINGTTNQTRRIDEQPNFDVYRVRLPESPANEPILISGSDQHIALQLSQLNAENQLLKYKLGQLTFEEWFSLWEVGFDKLPTRPETNYPAAGQNAWRKKLDSRPKFRRWSNPNKKAKINSQIKVIEYWPDRSETSKSYVLSGTDWQLMQQILGIHYYGGSSTQQSPRSQIFSGTNSFKGLPKIKLFFIEDPETVDAAYPPIRAELSFRILGKTERWDLVDQGKTNLEKLRGTDVKQIATRIVENFAKPTPYKLHKGKIIATYFNKTQGVRSWCQVYSRSDGVELFDKLCQVIGVPFNRTNLTYSEPDDSLTEFPTIPPKMSVMGAEFKGVRRRPSGHVYFAYSTLSLESLAYDIGLTNNSTVIFEENKLQETQSGSGIQF